MKNSELKNTIKKKLDLWLNELKINEEEGFYVYPTKDRFLIVVHLKDGSYREDKEKSLKECMGD